MLDCHKFIGLNQVGDGEGDVGDQVLRGEAELHAALAGRDINAFV